MFEVQPIIDAGREESDDEWRVRTEFVSVSRRPKQSLYALVIDADVRIAKTQDQYKNCPR